MGAIVFASSFPTIRDRQVAAPLKQEDNRHRMVADLFGYPRPSGRGPIEANPRLHQWASLLPIRDRQVAAPLKRLPALPTVPRTSAIRDRQVAAPLKRIHTCHQRRQPHLSATVRSRPH